MFLHTAVPTEITGNVATLGYGLVGVGIILVGIAVYFFVRARAR